MPKEVICCDGLICDFYTSNELGAMPSPAPRRLDCQSEDPGFGSSEVGE